MKSRKSYKFLSWKFQHQNFHSVFKTAPILLLILTRNLMKNTQQTCSEIRLNVLTAETKLQNGFPIFSARKFGYLFHQKGKKSKSVAFTLRIQSQCNFICWIFFRFYFLFLWPGIFIPTNCSDNCDNRLNIIISIIKFQISFFYQSFFSGIVGDFNYQKFPILLQVITLILNQSFFIKLCLRNKIFYNFWVKFFLNTDLLDSIWAFHAKSISVKLINYKL